MKEVRRINDHHVYAAVPDLDAKGHRMETARKIKDFNSTADDPENVRCRLVVQQYKNFVQRRHAPWNSTAVVVETLAQFGSVQTTQGKRDSHSEAQRWHSFTLFSPTKRGFTWDLRVACEDRDAAGASKHLVWPTAARSP